MRLSIRQNTELSLRLLAWTITIIQVIDTGIDIPADKMEYVFERFHRVLDKNSEQPTEVGIGLALIKGLVRAHQGRIELDNEVAKGTSVSIFLPVINESDDGQVSSHSNAQLCW